MKKLLLSLLLLLISLSAFGRGQLQGWVEQGGQPALASIVSTIKVQRSYPSSIVTVYLTGTTTLATIYSDNSGTPKANPFTATTLGSWSFYVDDGTYDIKFSGGGITTPFTRTYALNGGSTTSIIYAASYGATCNGVDDNTAALQAAIDAGLRFIGGGNHQATIIVPQGVCITRTLLFNNIAHPAGGIIFSGVGINNTTLKLKNATNAPLLDFGGASVLDNAGVWALRDMSLFGNSANQTIAAPVVRMRNCDRFSVNHVYEQDSKGDGWYISNSSGILSEVQSFINTQYGVNIEDSTSMIFRDGYINNNTLTGLRCHWTGVSGAQVQAQYQTGLEVLNTHFEQNTGGEILIDTWDNAHIHDNEFDALDAAYISGVIQITGGSRNNVVINNSTVSSAPLGTSSSGSASGSIFLALGAQTLNNIYDTPKAFTSAGGGASVSGLGNSRIVDLGVGNRSLDPTAAIVDFDGKWGGYYAAGWQGVSRPNLLLRSENLADAAWSKTQASVALDASYGNPAIPIYNTIYNSSAITPVAGQESFVQQAVTGLSLAAGNKITFSIWLLASSACDVRLELRDSSNVLLGSPTFVWLNDLSRDSGNTNVLNWKRFKVSYVATGSLSEVRVRIARYGGSPGQIYAWGAQLNEGDMAPYVPTTTVAASLPVGLVAMGVHATKSMGASLPQYANNAAAVAGGLAVGEFYHTGSDPDTVCVVH